MKEGKTKNNRRWRKKMGERREPSGSLRREKGSPVPSPVHYQLVSFADFLLFCPIFCLPTPTKEPSPTPQSPYLVPLPLFGATIIVSVKKSRKKVSVLFL